MPEPQHNVNPAQAITWFVGVTIDCTFSGNNSPPPRQFLCNKILLKKISNSKEMHIEQNLNWESLGLMAVYVRTPITGCFHGKTIISMENLRVDCYLLLKYCRRQCTLLPLPGPSHLQNLTPKCKILNVFWTEIASKRRTEQINFFNWLSNVKNLVLSNGFEYVQNVIQWC